MSHGHTHAAIDERFRPYTPIDFEAVNAIANRFADIIEEKKEELEHILLKYESFEVAEDEISRTLDLLRSLPENAEYFKFRIGEVAAFLPRNQPLYAFSCFVVIPSLMASSAHFRIPHSMKHFLADVLELLDVEQLFPNIVISKKQRIDFLTERSALRVDPSTGESHPVTEAVIFTGLPLHAEQLRLVFDKRTLFITNGAGHNPVVVGANADLDAAVEAVTTLQFYNQGQDCAAPNAVLIEKGIYKEFLSRVHAMLKVIKIGYYFDRGCRIGPISDPKDLVRIQDFLVENSTWLDFYTPGTIQTRDAIVSPTIIIKPLKAGGNFNEIFAPIMFIQEYENDAELKAYFEDKRYALNAMYVTLYGESDYVRGLIGREIDGKVLHTSETFLHNKHLHMPGMERGTCQYGGYGYGASNASIDGKIMPMPTLPQRDIFRFVAEPLMKMAAAGAPTELFATYTHFETKNVQKIMRLHTEESTTTHDSHEEFGQAYIDTHSLKNSATRYAEINDEDVCRLLALPNTAFIAALLPGQRKDIHALHELLEMREELDAEQFKEKLYAIPKNGETDQTIFQEKQRRFFKNIYMLLFGVESGPKLTIFLREADIHTLKTLLDV